MAIADNIRQFLKSKNLTNKEFCQRIGVTENGFKKMLDSGSFKYEMLQIIAQKLEVPVWEVTGDYPKEYEGSGIVAAGEAWHKDVNRITKENEALKQSLKAMEELNYALELQIKALKALHSRPVNQQKTNEP